MAVLAITNALLYHVETLADLEALGSNNNISTDCVAWVEGIKSWVYPETVSASTSTWKSFGMTLIDTVEVTAGGGATSLTISGLDGNNDGTYYLTGRASFAASNPALEVRPNGLTSNLASVMTGGIVNSTTGWLIGGWIIPEGSTPDGNMHIDAWIYPAENQHGSSSTRSGRRMYHGIATQVAAATPSTANINVGPVGGTWNEASTNMTSLEIIAAAGTMEQGTQFSLYKLEDQN